MLPFRFPLLLLLASAGAHAEPLVATIPDRELWSKIDLVYLDRAEGTFPASAEPAIVTQRDRVLRPHLLPIVAGTLVSFESEEPDLHSLIATSDGAIAWSAVLPPGGTVARTFRQPGIYRLACGMHASAPGYVLVLQNPFFTRIDGANGAFTLLGVPPGRYDVRIWGERLSDAQNARRFRVVVLDSSGQNAVAQN